MRIVKNEEFAFISGSAVKMDMEANNIMYIITGGSEFDLDNETKITSDMLYYKNRPCPSVFSDSGIVIGNCVYKAYPVDKGTRYVKII